MRSVANRLKKLEQINARTVYKPPALVLGDLKQLPRDYVGEKHIVMLNRQQHPTHPRVFNCEFEERPGPEPRKRTTDTRENEIHIHFLGSREPEAVARIPQRAAGDCIGLGLAVPPV